MFLTTTQKHLLDRSSPFLLLPAIKNFITLLPLFFPMVVLPFWGQIKQHMSKEPLHTIMMSKRSPHLGFSMALFDQ
jgi:hypothetical protein